MFPQIVKNRKQQTRLVDTQNVVHGNMEQLHSHFQAQEKELGKKELELKEEKKLRDQVTYQLKKSLEDKQQVEMELAQEVRARQEVISRIGTVSRMFQALKDKANALSELCKQSGWITFFVINYLNIVFPSQCFS